MKRKKRGLPRTFRDLPQAPRSTTHADALEAAGVPPDLQTAVGYAQAIYVAIAMVQAVGHPIVLPPDWGERAGMGGPDAAAGDPDGLVLTTRWLPEEEGGGYEVAVRRYGDVAPADPGMN